jgi:hypothetical protein
MTPAVSSQPGLTGVTFSRMGYEFTADFEELPLNIRSFSVCGLLPGPELAPLKQARAEMQRPAAKE